MASNSIIIVFPAFGFILLCMALLALCCCLKKKKKKKSKRVLVEETEVKHIDENMRVKENIAKGPNGRPESFVVSVEEDMHVDDDIIRKKKELKAQNMHAKSSETTPSALEAGHSS
ncbi:protein TRACHEARY ELEMENT DIFFERENTIATION-RELATED 6-like [Lycium ferocissimum]|uniref:protein TRACHEARY ELEMENT DIFFERENTIATION-RELATED 6-like n=1 Tax=Lycium ferocissimum TaxID=112874 RepID=UPI002815EE8F|nr:protein TRACHEARY ELEMENT DIFFERENTIATION-RELATED 6-like [Lycium ferocissimum]